MKSKIFSIVGPCYGLHFGFDFGDRPGVQRHWNGEDQGDQEAAQSSEREKTILQ